MIAGLSANGSLQSLYPQYNKKKVTGVKKVNREHASLENAEKTEHTDAMEDMATSNYVAALMAEATEYELLYDPQNPYSQSKKILDQSFLLGTYVDERI